MSDTTDQTVPAKQWGLLVEAADALDWRTSYKPTKPLEHANARTAALEAENKRLREDAERYRWLRLSSNKDTPAIFSTRGDSAERCLLGADADAAIDAARAQQESGNDR